MPLTHRKRASLHGLCRAQIVLTAADVQAPFACAPPADPAHPCRAATHDRNPVRRRVRRRLIYLDIAILVRTRRLERGRLDLSDPRHAVDRPRRCRNDASASPVARPKLDHDIRPGVERIGRLRGVHRAPDQRDEASGRRPSVAAIRALGIGARLVLAPDPHAVHLPLRASLLSDASTRSVARARRTEVSERAAAQLPGFRLLLLRDRHDVSSLRRRRREPLAAPPGPAAWPAVLRLQCRHSRHEHQYHRDGDRQCIGRRCSLRW